MAEPATIFDMFAAVAATEGQLPFLAVPSNPGRDYLPDGAEYSYAEAMTEVAAISVAFREAGFMPGHRVALVLGNRPDHFWYLLALNAIGACAVPLNPEYLPHEFAYAMDKVEAAAVVASPDVVERVQEAAEQAEIRIPVFVLGEALSDIPKPARKPAPDVSTASERAALIIFTSGTTSRPKGCVISNYSCLESGRSYAEAGGLIGLEPRRERLFNPLPTFHMNSTVLSLTAMLRQRGCLIVADRFRASSWWSEIRATRATGVHYLGIIPPVLLKAPITPDEGAPTVRFGVGAG